jgi:hypothetical protein
VSDLILYTYLLLTATGHMPGGSVYEAHTFNKETDPTSHEIARYITRIFKVQVHEHSQYIYIGTIQVHEHYKTQERENTEKTQKIRKDTESTNILPGNEPGPSSP